jgi:hypothetical protein
MAVKHVVTLGYGFSGGGVSFIPTLGFSSAEVVQQTDFDDDEVWNGGARSIVWTIRGRATMGSRYTDSNDAVDTLTAFTFSDRVRFVDMERRLPGTDTLSAVAHEKTERWTVTDGTGAWVEVDDGPAITEETVNASTVTVYHGDDELRTIGTGEGFSFRAAGGEAGTYRLTFSYTADGEDDGVRVCLTVEE